MISNFLSLLALALLACEQVNALSLDPGHLHARHDHAVLAKRTVNKRCKPRPATTTPKPQSAVATPPPVSNNPAPSNSNAKAGLAWSRGDNVDILRAFKLNHVSRIYNWSPYKVPGAEAAGYKSIPMFGKPQQEPEFDTLVVQGYADHILGFNEPDLPKQADMAVDTAVDLWNKKMIPLRNKGYTLISPAVASSENGLAWIRDFLGKCRDCVDKIALHWYGKSANEFQTYVEARHNEFGKPIWVTEFACVLFVGGGMEPCGTDEALAFAGQVRRFMDSASYVEAYFPFAIVDSAAVGEGNVLIRDGKPTDLAHIYFD